MVDDQIAEMVGEIVVLIDQIHQVMDFQIKTHRQRAFLLLNHVNLVKLQIVVFLLPNHVNLVKLQTQLHQSQKKIDTVKVNAAKPKNLAPKRRASRRAHQNRLEIFLPNQK